VTLPVLARRSATDDSARTPQGATRATGQDSVHDMTAQHSCTSIPAYSALPCLTGGRHACGAARASYPWGQHDRVVH